MGKKYELADLTALEQQFIREVTCDGTGYIYAERVDMDPQVMGGVITNLMDKGIIDREIVDRNLVTRYELFPCGEYEEWFEGLYA